MPETEWRLFGITQAPLDAGNVVEDFPGPLISGSGRHTGCPSLVHLVQHGKCSYLSVGPWDAVGEKVAGVSHFVLSAFVYLEAD